MGAVPMRGLAINVLCRFGIHWWGAWEPDVQGHVIRRCAWCGDWQRRFFG